MPAGLCMCVCVCVCVRVGVGGWVGGWVGVWMGGCIERVCVLSAPCRHAGLRVSLVNT